jgi:hypothetical protein
MGGGGMLYIIAIQYATGMLYRIFYIFLYIK